MSARERRVTQLVVIGASAGGIEALTQLVGSLPADFPVPLVVAQHLSPRRPHVLAEILSRHTPLAIRTVDTHESLEPGVIYVVPPNRDVTITDHRVLLQTSAGGPQPSVDRLFRTAAEAFGENLTAVILSGSGSDGAAGARVVKEAGGTVLVQNPETAAFPGMPLSLAPSMVDVVADAGRIGPLLAELVGGTYHVPPPTEDGQLQGFLDQLREESGIEFAAYKQPTIARRLQRRMAATGHADLSDYIRYARQHGEERRRLIASFLIQVTEFFRDPEVFDYLRDHVLPELIETARGRDGLLRFWSAGCATGEEVYSLAVTVAEALDGVEMEGGVRARIFATDVDAQAVQFARRGIYPARALAHVPPDSLGKYFTALDGEYEAKKSLRSLVVFGEHDLTRRAAFPHTDLVLCRNVLIYFTPALQRRALQLFAFSLRSSGYLVLGKSETTTPLAEFFAVDEPRLKVFRRIGERVTVLPNWHGANWGAPRRSPGSQAQPGEGGFPALLRSPRPLADPPRRLVSHGEEEALLGLPIGVVVVNANYDIQSINAMARRLFGIHSAALGHDFIHLIQEMPTAPIRQAIDRALNNGSVEPFLLTTGDELAGIHHSLELSCFAINRDDDPAVSLVATTALDVTERERLRQQYEEIAARLHRLQMSNEAILAANDALTDGMAKLRADNEDLQVAREEAQAATEEVETLNEEMQASNEELETLNEELQATVEELNTANDDLEARSLELQELAARNATERGQIDMVLQNVADAVIVVNQQGHIVLANALGDQLFGAVATTGAIENEAGVPLPADETPQARAARGETFELTFMVRQEDGTRRTYEAIGQPLSTETLSGQSVLTVRDVTERSLRQMQDRWLAIAAHELRTPLTALQGGLQLAVRSFAAGNDERGRRRLDQAMEQVLRIGSMVTQMMDAARLRTGAMVLARELLDLVPLVAHVAETIRLVAPGRSFEVSSVEEPLPIVGDPQRVEQALLNLLTNAITYAPPELPIVIRLTHEDGTAAIAIADRGPGIPAAEVPHVFDQFRRLERGTREAPGGLGLGLFVAREIVHGLHGKIDVDSREGEGTTFTIRLPIAASGAPASPEAEGA